VRLVIFELDGTITRGDTLLPYVAGFLAQRPWRLWRLLRATPAALLFALGRIDRGELKSRLLRVTLRGHSHAELEYWNARFVPRLLAGGVRRQALAALEDHRRAGDVLVLMSASPDLYVPAIGRELGFGKVISTGVRWQQDRLSGELTTPNRRGAEKLRCLEELQRAHPGLPTLAYGNAASDLPHLVATDVPRLVNASRPTRRKAARQGVTLYAHWH
jgi:phosphatidylglycerophosphatase C